MTPAASSQRPSRFPRSSSRHGVSGDEPERKEAAGTSVRRHRIAAVALLTILVLLAPDTVRAETWAEKLGYPPGKRVLILHADDIGMCYEANRAAKSYLEKGEIQSASAMVPCPWFDEFAAWYREHPEVDVGLHLTLTSEWRYYRWGPISERSKVPGLVDADGYLHRSVRAVARSATPEEVETEIRAQIERALSRGIRPGHIDTHMGTLYARPEFARAYLAAAVEYRIPAMVIELTPRMIERYRARGYPLSDEVLEMSSEYPFPKLDDFRSLPKGADYDEVRARFFELVRSLEPGITEIIFHPSVATEGLRKITGSWRQRSDEARLFSDPRVKAFFENEGVLFTDWKEMMRRHEERDGTQGSVEEDRSAERTEPHH